MGSNFIKKNEEHIKLPCGDVLIFGSFNCPICGRPIYVRSFSIGRVFYALYHFNPEDVEDLCPIAQDDSIDGELLPMQTLGGITYNSLEEIAESWVKGIKTVKKDVEE